MNDSERRGPNGPGERHRCTRRLTPGRILAYAALTALALAAACGGGSGGGVSKLLSWDSGTWDVSTWQ